MGGDGVGGGVGDGVEAVGEFDGGSMEVDFGWIGGGHGLAGTWTTALVVLVSGADIVVVRVGGAGGVGDGNWDLSEVSPGFSSLSCRILRHNKISLVGGCDFRGFSSNPQRVDPNAIFRGSNSDAKGMNFSILRQLSEGFSNAGRLLGRVRGNLREQCAGN